MVSQKQDTTRHIFKHKTSNGTTSTMKESQILMWRTLEINLLVVSKRILLAMTRKRRKMPTFCSTKK